MERSKDFKQRRERFFRLPPQGRSITEVQTEFDIAKERFPVVGDEQFAKPGTLPDPAALDLAFDMVRTRNPNLVEPSMFLGAWEIEREAVSMIAELFNHPNYSQQGYNPNGNPVNPVLGWFTDGGTSSILQASWALRNKYFSQLQSKRHYSLEEDIIREEGWLGLVRKGIVDQNKPPVILAPVDMHFAGDKCVDILGIGSRNIVRYDLRESYQTDYPQLETIITNLRKEKREVLFAFVSAGAVDTGRVENVEEFANTLAKADCPAPVIVDAAQQFLLLALLSGQYPAWDFRVKAVEAIIADPHKTDASPYPGSLVIFKDKEIARYTRSIAGYLHNTDALDFDLKETWNLMPSFHTSRSPIGAVCTWAHLLLQGKEKLIERYQQLMDFTNTIADYIKNSEYYSLISTPQTAIIPFHVKSFVDNKAERVYQEFVNTREEPRFYISFADCLRLRTSIDHNDYELKKKADPLNKFLGYGGLYIQIMQHTTPELVDKLIERLEMVGKKVMG